MTRKTESTGSCRPGFGALALAALLLGGIGCSPGPARKDERTETSQRSSAEEVRLRYLKHEALVPMRDGVRLFTTIYSPRDTSRRYPMLMIRTPYSVSPYGESAYPERVGPSPFMQKEGYIFVYQDVRGCYMSEGQFEDMRPHQAGKKSGEIDESTDTWDTIDWLLSNVDNHNSRVGMWGISYPGFYAAAGMIDAHPALRAVSPQAPIADWYFDDFHHHGAFFLPHAFNFFASFGQARPEPSTEHGKRFDHGTPDGYQFFMDLGSLKNADERYFKGEIKFWDLLVEHPHYDDFWQERNILPHLQNVAPAVMTVGGWFDAEDLYGPLKIYHEVEQRNPQVFNILVMGPWRHGGWARGDGDRLGDARFDAKTSLYYQGHVERAFFDYYLKDGPPPELPEALVFETGENRWRRFPNWPPSGLQVRDLHLHAGGVLDFEPAAEPPGAADEFISDPAKPVPFTADISTRMVPDYMTADQRFAARRPDVLSYQTAPLDEDLTLAGPLQAELWVETTGTAADWVVKLIDVFPPDAEDPEGLPPGVRMGGYQMMIRSEVLRGCYRNGYERPEAFVPGQPTVVRLELLDVLHTFKKGHRVMIQVQSSWFPLVDRNPQTHVANIFLAEEADFVKATHRVHRSPQYPSRVRVGVLEVEQPAD